MSKEKRLANKIRRQTSGSNIGPTQDVASGMILPNHSGDHSAGRVLTTPTVDNQIANKAYVDSQSGAAPEGTAVKSTGEAGGTKFLREDGDNTCSWQTAPSQLTTEEVQDIAGPLIATGGTKTNITITYQDATGDMDFAVDDAFIVNDADDTSTGKITAANFAVTGDNNTNDTEYVPMVLHGTDATPPTASTVPRGTIYIQYTA